MSEIYLSHHGILGQKWGVRRFQNKDGTRTAAGKARETGRYDRMNEKKLYKTLKKEIRNERSKQYPGGNRWHWDKEIGEHGKTLRAENDAKRKEYENSDAYKKWVSKVDKMDADFQRLVDSGEMSIDEYDRQWNALMKERPKRNYNDINDIGYSVSGTGRKYFNDYVNKGGKDITIARIQDLGFSEEDAKKYTKKLAKKGYTLGDI